MTNRFRNQLLMSTLLAGVASVASPAFAQDGQSGAPKAPPPAAVDAGVQPQAAQPDTAQNTGDVVVTGTLIRNPNLISSGPVNVINDAEITLRAPSTVEEALRGIPGITPGIGTAVNNGSNGTNTVDLRGIGIQRNLVLLDGNRLVPTLANGATDLNIIPLALIQRIDVLTGGASTTYGADAVSGVVNFVTRRDFTGVDLRAQYKLPTAGEGKSYRADLTLGANFADDKGNAVISLGYTKIDPIYQTAPFANFGISSTSGKASGASFTSVPTTIAFPTANLQVSPDSSQLVPQYQGYNFNPYNIFQTPLERKSAYAATHYEVADGIEVYARGLFNNDTIQSIIAPSGVFGLGLTVPANNPYLNATTQSQICAQNFAGQTAAGNAAYNPANPASAKNNPAIAAAYFADAARYTPGNCAAQTGTTAFIAPTATSATTAAGGTPGTALALPGVYRRAVELGPRIGTYENTTYDARVGAIFDLTKSIKFDLNASYGRNEQTLTNSGYVLNSRVQQALNATNTATCTVTTNNCVPLNLFGQAGSITAAQNGFIQGQSTVRINTELKQIRGTFTGDFGYTLPSASQPISFAAGGEYREYTYQRIPDAFAQSTTELGGAGGAVLPFTGRYNVKEGFGELIAPLISDKPFFQDLTLQAGARYSAYSIQAANNPSFNTTTYKGGATWKPAQGLLFRGNYQRAVRAPNIGELFAPVVTGLTNLTVDPCAGAAPTTNANLAAICRAQGAPSVGAIQNPSGGQPNETGGGNPNIRPEKADTFTVGFVVTPSHYVPGLSFSVDYYNIIINQAITTATPGDVLNACFNNITAASATSPACLAIFRNPVNGNLSGPSSTTLGLLLPETNNGRIKTDGVDLTANYVRKFGDYGLDLNFAGNWTHNQKFQASPASVSRDCVGYYSANCGFSLGQITPQYSFQQRTTLTYAGVNLSVLWRYLSPVRYEGQASDYLARGFTAANRNLFAGTVVNAAGANSALAGQTFNFNRIQAYNYFDGNIQFNVAPAYQLTLSVTNIFDRKPPVVGGQAGSTAANSGNTFPSVYDAIGRTVSAAIRLKF